MKGKIIPLILLVILVIALPLLLIEIKQRLDGRSHAAAADKLEAEGGVLSGNAANKQDSNASGGNYVLFQTQSSFAITAGPSVSNITNTGAEITWTLSEPATGQIEYGTTSSYGSLSSHEISFNYSTHIQTLSNLTAGTLYHYRVRSSNQAGTQIVSPDKTFTTTSSNSTPTPTPNSNSQTGTGGTHTPQFVSVTGGGAMPSLTGAISTTSYGAKGDGVTDDTTALKNAANAAATAGKPLVIPATSTFYKISGPITIKGSVLGTGGMPTIKQTNTSGNTGTAAIFIVSADTTGWIYNLHLVGTYAGQYFNYRSNPPSYPNAVYPSNGEWAHAISLSGVNGVTIKGNLIENVWGDGVSDGSTNTTTPARNVLIDNNTFNNAMRCEISSTTLTNGWAIMNNKFIHQSYYVNPIDLEPNGDPDFITNYEFGFNQFSITSPYAVIEITNYFDPTPGGNIWVHDNSGTWPGIFVQQTGYQGGTSAWTNVNITNNNKTP